jgi:LacI family transcriptional regulator
MHRKARLKDVAMRAGVSTATASYVLNDTPGARVAVATRDRVHAAAREVGYRPNVLARGLRTRRTRMIGFVSDDVATSPYASGMIRGAQDAARQAGYMLLLVNTEHGNQAHDDAVHALLQRQVDGVVFATMYHQVIDVPGELASVPHVLLDCRPPDGTGTYVVPDERGGAEAVMAELLAPGHRRIAHISDRLNSPAAGMRLAAYRDALKQSGIRFDGSLVVAEEPDHVGGWRAAAQLLDRRRPPTALFCFNDRMAAGAYRAAAERGLAIPEDLSVVGFDDQPLLADALWPGLTTAAIPHRAMGEWALAALLDFVEAAASGESGEAMVMPCDLVRRSSVGPPPNHPPNRSRAISAAGEDAP